MSSRISATENVVPLEIQGGDRHSSTLHIEFSRLDTTDIPAYEDVEDGYYEEGYEE